MLRQTARRPREAGVAGCCMAPVSAVLIPVAGGVVHLALVVSRHAGLAATALAGGRTVLLFVLLVGGVRILVVVPVRIAFLVGWHHELRGCDRCWSRTTLRRPVLGAGGRNVSA